MPRRSPGISANWRTWATPGYRIRMSFAFSDLQRKILPPLPLLRLTLQLLPVSPALDRINGASALHHPIPPHFEA